MSCSYTYTMPLGVSSFQTRVTKDTRKSVMDMPSRRRLSSRGGCADASAEAVLLAAPFLDFFWGFGLETAFFGVEGADEVAEESSGAVSGGGVSGADSPSPCKKNLK